MVGGLFSADAWATVTFTASEVKDPRRDLPRALAMGAGIVILLYILTNVSYLFELPAVSIATNAPAGAGAGARVFAHGIAGAESDRVAAAAMRMVWGGAGATITAILLMVSTFGCANGLVLPRARAISPSATDGGGLPLAA